MVLRLRVVWVAALVLACSSSSSTQSGAGGGGAQGGSATAGRGGTSGRAGAAGSGAGGGAGAAGVGGAAGTASAAGVSGAAGPGGAGGSNAGAGGGTAGSSGGAAGAGGGAGWKPTPADQAFIASLCALTEACCVQNAYRTQPDVAGCTSKLANAGVSSDATVQQACLAELQALAASASCLPEEWQLSDPCVRVFYEPSGPQPPGAPCVHSGDCAGAAGKVTICSVAPVGSSPTGSLCLQLAPGMAGDQTCLAEMNEDGVILAAAHRGPSGGLPPVTTGYVCQRRNGVRCSGTMGTSDPSTTACVALLPDGAACQDATLCASGICTGNLGLTGTCTEGVPAGQLCIPDLCDHASYCNSYPPAAYTCAAKLPPGSDCSGGGNASCTSGNCPNGTNICSAETHAESIALLAFCGALL